MQSPQNIGQAGHGAPESTEEAVVLPLYFGAHAHCCEFGDCAIVLDLRSNSYIGIDAKSFIGLRGRIENWPHPQGSQYGPPCRNVATDEQLVAELLARGILTTVPQPTPSLPIPNPTEAATVANFAKIRKGIPPRHMVHFAIAFLVVTVLMRRRNLPRLLDWPAALVRTSPGLLV